MYQPEGFTELAHAIKRQSRKNIWCYTGYTFETLLHNPRQAKLLEYIDVLVDGKFKEELRDEDLYFRGSSNQRLIDVQASLKAKKAVDVPRFRIMTARTSVGTSGCVDGGTEPRTVHRSIFYYIKNGKHYSTFNFHGLLCRSARRAWLDSSGR